jgi:hypothetical protein
MSAERALWYTIHVRVTCDPADVCHAGKLVIRVDVKHVFHRQGSAQKITASGMDNSFGLACGARSLK